MIVLVVGGAVLGLGAVSAVAACILGGRSELGAACFPPLEDDQAIRRRLSDCWTLREVMEHFGLDDADLISPAAAWSDDEREWALELRGTPAGGGVVTALSGRQRRILGAISESIERRGYAPSMREIGEAVGLTSTSSVAHQLDVLERLGFIRRDASRPRALVVVEPDAATLRRMQGLPQEAGIDAGLQRKAATS